MGQGHKSPSVETHQTFRGRWGKCVIAGKVSITGVYVPVCIYHPALSAHDHKSPSSTLTIPPTAMGTTATSEILTAFTAFIMFNHHSASPPSSPFIGLFITIAYVFRSHSLSLSFTSTCVSYTLVFPL